MRLRADRISVRDQSQPEVHSSIQTHHPRCNHVIYLGRQNMICVGAAATKDLLNLQLQSKWTYNSTCVRGWCVWGSLTSAKSKKVRLVGIPLQQRRHSVSHSLVALVDEFLAEVVVYLLGCDAVVSWQGAVDELRQLNKERRGENLITNYLKLTSDTKKTDTNAESVGMLWLISWWMKSATLNVPLGCLFIFLKVDQRSYEREADEHQTAESVFRRLQHVFVGDWVP